MDELSFRPALRREADSLGSLALRSKSHWGYDEDFLNSCAAELELSPDELERRRVTVAVVGADVVGFYTLEGQPPEADLGNLWVEPDRIGMGLGRRIWQHALDTARELGFDSLAVEADPYAEGFYRAMGAHRTGATPSGSIPDRFLPVLRVDL